MDIFKGTFREIYIQPYGGIKKGSNYKKVHIFKSHNL